jgi:hypothetical protein
VTDVLSERTAWRAGGAAMEYSCEGDKDHARRSGLRVVIDERILIHPRSTSLKARRMLDTGSSVQASECRLPPRPPLFALHAAACGSRTHLAE